MAHYDWRFFAIADSEETAKKLAEANRIPSETTVPARYHTIPGIVELCRLSLPKETAIRGVIAYTTGLTTKYPVLYRRTDHTCSTWSTWEPVCTFCRHEPNWWLSIMTGEVSNHYGLSLEHHVPVPTSQEHRQRAMSELRERLLWPLERFINASSVERPN